MTAAQRSALDGLEVFARAVESLRRARVEVDVAALAELYDVAWPDDDDDDDLDDEDEPTTEELAAAYLARTTE